jgi:hypothetical protein
MTTTLFLKISVSYCINIINAIILNIIIVYHRFEILKK